MLRISCHCLHDGTQLSADIQGKKLEYGIVAKLFGEGSPFRGSYTTITTTCWHVREGC